ncbi:MAG: hypothetical protein ABIF01_01155 [Candidatus Micrarchaeota archaeon]
MKFQRDELKKAQAAMEFATIFGFFALVFLMISVTLLERQATGIEVKRGELVKGICLTLQDEVTNAVLMGDGYWKHFMLNVFSGEEYRIIIREKNIEVVIGEPGRETFFVCTNPAGMMGEINAGNELSLDVSKEVRIKNIGGVVYIEQ